MKNKHRGGNKKERDFAAVLLPNLEINTKVRAGRKTYPQV
jgi:hypothetical protein